MLRRMSPLHVAVLQDSVELTSLLLQHGAQVDSADKKGLMLVIALLLLLSLPPRDMNLS